MPLSILAHLDKEAWLNLYYERGHAYPSPD
jgi:hypothetical protein